MLLFSKRLLSSSSSYFFKDELAVGRRGMYLVGLGRVIRLLAQAPEGARLRMHVLFLFATQPAPENNANCGEE